MKDRVVQYPHRYQLVPVAGESDTYDIIAKPGTITEVGTPLNKATLLSDATAALYGLTGDDATVDKALAEAIVKVGEIRTFGHEVTDPRWIPCNGQWVSNNEYPELAEVIDIKWEKEKSLTLVERDSKFGSNDIYDVAYGNGIIVEVGEAGKISTSSNGGLTWTLRTSGFGTTDIRSVAFGNGKFVAVGLGGKISMSTNGIDWTLQSSGTSTDIWNITFGNGKFYAFGSNRSVGVSTNGTSWTWGNRSGLPSGSPRCVRYLNGRIFYADGSSTTKVYISNDDSVTFYSVTYTATAAQIFDFFEHNEDIYALAGSGIFVSSDNGATWEKSPHTGSINGWKRAAFGKNMWVLITEPSMSSSIYYSFDLITFTSVTSGAVINSLIYADGNFVIGRANGTISTIARPLNHFVVPPYNTEMPFTYIKGAK